MCMQLGVVKLTYKTGGVRNTQKFDKLVKTRAYAVE